MVPSYTVGELASLVGGELRGDGSGRIRGVSDVSEAQPDQATWVTRPQYARKLVESKAGAVLVARDFGETPMPAILCDRLDRSVARLLGAFAPASNVPEPGIHPLAVVDPSATVGDGAAIGPHVVIGPGSRIGRSCVLHSGVVIGRDVTLGDDCLLWNNVFVGDRCTLGHRVIIQPNAVIGSDGFGYYLDDGHYCRVPHIGAVILEDDVEIGACACVDRAKFGNTVLGLGAKIDNLVQIAHNVRIGKDCVIAGQSGVAGSVRIGDQCVVGGQAGIVDNVEIGSGARLGAMSVVTRSVAPGQSVTGWPIQEMSRALRTQALTIRLPEMAAQLKELLARVERLEATKHDSA